MALFTPNLYSITLKHAKIYFAMMSLSFALNLFLLIQHIYFQLYQQIWLNLPDSNMIRYSQHRYFFFFFTVDLLLFILFLINIQKLKAILPLIKWLYPCIFCITLFYLPIPNFIGFCAFFTLISIYQQYKNIIDHAHNR